MAEERSSARVREACPEDIPGVVWAVASSISDGEDEGFGGPNKDSPFRDARRLASAWHAPNRVGSEEVFVAELEGRIVGVATVEDRGQAFELVDIDVSRIYQNKGIGTQMVRFIEETARSRGKAAVTLGTSRNAQGVPWKSLPWWVSRGYRITHEEENAWTRSIGPGAKEIRMRKDL